MNRIVICLAAFLVVLNLLGDRTKAFAASEVYAPLKSDDVRERVRNWLTEQNTSDENHKKVAAIWMGMDETISQDRLLDLVVQSFATVDADVMKLVRECNTPSAGPAVPHVEMLTNPARGPFFLANVGLFYGRYLVERRLFDEAWEVLRNIDARQVVDPASLFFFQAVAAQGMLDLKPALAAIDQLLTNTERVPVRYSAAAVLMQADLKGIQEKSLGEIARLMADSERRLELGRVGEKVQSVQEKIISNLDEIIKKIEQQQGGGGGSGKGGNNNNPDGGTSDSTVKGAEAPGETDKKRFDNNGSWGNLNEKELAKAKNDLNKNFPSHYEQAIEKYTRKLASRQAKKAK